MNKPPMKGWRTYARLFLGQMRDRTAPVRERWVRAHRMGRCGWLLVGKQQIMRSHFKWIKW